MLVSEILQQVDLNVYVPDNLLNEDLGEIEPIGYIKTNSHYIIQFKNTSFVITINTENFEEYFVMTETFDKGWQNYTAYTIEGTLYKIA